MRNVCVYIYIYVVVVLLLFLLLLLFILFLLLTEWSDKEVEALVVSVMVDMAFRMTEPEIG